MEKRDAPASHSTWAHKPNMNGSNVLLYGSLSTKVDKWSIHAIEDIVLGCVTSCQGLSVTR
uniref:Uncharacterized protein n=1 Tax=Hyaloperonospora arabidopsidis (strain Emoy2) TaxID=559515 RepID=M4B1F6_HYAAE